MRMKRNIVDVIEIEMKCLKNLVIRFQQSISNRYTSDTHRLQDLKLPLQCYIIDTYIMKGTSEPSYCPYL